MQLFLYFFNCFLRFYFLFLTFEFLHGFIFLDVIINIDHQLHKLCPFLINHTVFHISCIVHRQFDDVSHLTVLFSLLSLILNLFNEIYKIVIPFLNLFQNIMVYQEFQVILKALNHFLFVKFMLKCLTFRLGIVYHLFCDLLTLLPLHIEPLYHLDIFVDIKGHVHF